MRRDDEDRAVPVINAETGFAACIKRGDAMTYEIEPLFREVGSFSVQKELKLTLVPERLKSDPVRTDSSSNGGIKAHAHGQTTIGVSDRRRRFDRCLTNLDLHSVPVAQQNELTGRLEVISLSIYR